MTGQRDGVDWYVPDHGDAGYDVDHYDVDISYKVEGNHLEGRARIHGRARADIDEITLDLHALKATKVTLNGRRVKYRVRRHKIHLRCAESLTKGQEFTVVVSYGGQPRQVRDKHLGRAGWEELTDGALVAAQPHGAPSWLPCNDRPSSKASYRIAVTVPTGYRAHANGLPVESHRGASTTTWVFEQSEPMATYLAMVHVGRYECVSLDGSVSSYALVPNPLLDRFPGAFARQAAMLQTFVEAFGPYPFRSYGVVVTEDELEIPLESQGLSTFGSNHLSEDWECERLVAHELAHQWYGNSLTVGRWQDIWLHEGFACYAEWIWSEARGDESAHDRAIRHHERLAQQRQDVVVSDPGPDLMFDDRVYKRGALTLHALRMTIGDEAFFDLLRGWTGEHAHGTVSTAQFIAHAQRSTDVPLGDLFESWLNQAELPGLPRSS